MSQERGRPLQNVVDAIPAEVAVVDGDWQILTVNGAWADFADRHPQGALLTLGQSFRRFCEWSVMAGRQESLDMLRAIEAIDAGATRHFSHSYRSVRDSVRYQISISSFELNGERFATISRYDVSELHMLRRERARLNANLMRAQTRLLRAQEDERNRIARELHDNAAQYLVGMNLAVARLRQVSNNPNVNCVADDLGELLDAFHRDLRGLTYLLHPPQIEQAGLHSAIATLCNGFGQRAGVDVQLRAFGEDRMSCSASEATAYRIVQEALSNIHRHANASRVRVRLSDQAHALFVVIEDNGVGMRQQPDAVAGLSALGVGITGMIARVTELGGRLVVRNRSDANGVVVAAAIPRQTPGADFPADEPETALAS